MKILATIKKEAIVLSRDLGGMALIFLMPLVLVVVMGLIQDNTFRGWQETRLDVLFVDEDHGRLSASLEQTFQASPNIRLVKALNGAALTPDEAHRLVRTGKYGTALIIPKGTDAALGRKTEAAVTGLLAHYGITEDKTGKTPPAPALQIFFDPAIKANFKQAMESAVEKMLIRIQMERSVAEVQRHLAAMTGKEKIEVDLSRMITATAQDAVDAHRPVVLNAVQHNIPGWSMFAMFFILFPLAGNLIKEREDGSMLRLRLIAGSQLPVIAGKFTLYLMVCLVQLVLMILAGLYAMPLLGLDRLVLGSNYTGIALTGLAVAMAATGYGLLIAVYFRTPHQALPFGSISVVILAALGGVWVPVFIMPEVMQQISPLSPLNWGMSALNQLFLRNAPTAAILPELAKLFGFALATLGGSYWVQKKRG